MRIFVIAFAVIAAASAASVSNEYLSPVANNNLPSQEYLPPAVAEEQTAISDDGYRYKTVRRLRLRHRRDVSEVVNQEYLPPVADSVAEEVPEQTVVADDGYRYKTVRRLKYRHRRDVNELPSNEYLPPADKTEEIAAEETPIEVPQDSTVLADDGYRYKTVRRLKYRHRRDVNELPSSEYLPAAEQSHDSSDTVAIEAPEESAVVADDGYHYKTVRRLKYRHRRDVNELPSNEYLPPTEKSEEVAAEEAPVEVPQESAALAVDGYRYKTVRRSKYRHRRDVNELPSSEYLPPTEKSEEPTDVVTVDAPVEVPQESTVLANDGYRYKTVRRLKFRHRRDVNELPSSEYLPPADKLEEVAVEKAPVEAPEESAALTEDGYRYKTVRRLKYRHRRDVNELPSSEYLPPVQKSEESSNVASVEAPVEAPQESTVLANDGYRYKTVRRLKFRHRRDVNELPSSEYLPPAEKSVEVAVEEAPIEAPQESAGLAIDGYRYKTVRRLKYRHRRDVNELTSNEYLPPAEESSDAVAVESPVVASQESGVLADDGYRYKTVRRLKYRHRRDVNELPSSEYLPPAEKSADQEVAVQNPEETSVLADDGYRYKVVRRLKYRHRQYD